MIRPHHSIQKDREIIQNYLDSISPDEKDKWIKVLTEKYPVDIEKRSKQIAEYKRQHRDEIAKQRRIKNMQTLVTKYPCIAFDFFNGTFTYPRQGRKSPNHERWTYKDDKKRTRCVSCNKPINCKPTETCQIQNHIDHYAKELDHINKKNRGEI